MRGRSAASTRNGTTLVADAGLITRPPVGAAGVDSLAVEPSAPAAIGAAAEHRIGAEAPSAMVSMPVSRAWAVRAVHVSNVNATRPVPTVEGSSVGERNGAGGSDRGCDRESENAFSGSHDITLSTGHAIPVAGFRPAVARNIFSV